MQNNIKIEWNWENLVNEAFLPLVEDKSRMIIMYGGRGSSKSTFACYKIIHNMLFHDYFKCIAARGTLNSTKDSSFKALKELIESEGLTDLFKINEQPAKIICKHNRNEIIFRGLDDVGKLKSIDNPSFLWIEEDLAAIDYNAWVTLTNSLRSSKAEYIQELYTINPVVKELDFQDNWFFKRYFSKHHPEKSFTDTTLIDVDRGDGKKKKVEVTVKVHHSTYRDNKFMTDEAIAQLLDSVTGTENDAYYYSRDVLGEWVNQQNGAAFYHQFNKAKHVSDTPIYNPDKPLHISFDFNSNPYMICSVWQFNDNGGVQAIEDIAPAAPKNNTHDTCRIFREKYINHKKEVGLFVYGDASGKAQNSRVEHGVNEFTIIASELAEFDPVFRVPEKNPAVKGRRTFINEILGKGYKGISILINERCKLLTNDLANLKEDPDGAKLKQAKKGVQIIGHFSDAMDYFLCEAFKKDYEAFNAGPTTFKPVFGGYVPNSKYSY